MTTESTKHTKRTLGSDRDSDVQKAQKQILSTGNYGPVTIQQWTGKTLPYNSDFINLIVADDTASVSATELFRVLAPSGVLLSKSKPNLSGTAFEMAKASDGWFNAVKPWPVGKDEWTHWLHSPDNNPVSRDTMKEIPRGLQWIQPPAWLKSHELNPPLSARLCQE